MAKIQKALITGASSGIGRCLSLAMARKGIRVVLCARREDKLQALAAEIRESGGTCEICVVDVSETESIRAAIARWDRQLDGLDLVIANAGVGRAKRAEKLAWADVEEVLRVNVFGAFATLMAGKECMLARNGGTLVGVSSLAALRGLPASGAYSASKAALATFLETLRIDLAPRGICVVDIRPGFVDTAMTRGNRFKMPFLIDAERAAELSLRGIEQGQAIVSYPWPMAAVLVAAELMPDVLWRGLAGKLNTGDKGRS